MWFLIIVALLVIAISIRIRKSMNYWEERKIPYIKPVPVFGNSALMILRQRTLVDHHLAIHNAYPNKRYYGTFQFMLPQLYIRDPELIKQITVKDFDHFTDRSNIITDDVEPIFGKSLNNMKGQKWRDLRAILTPTFTSSNMKYLFPLISDRAEQFTRYFEEETSKGIIEVEAWDTAARIITDIIATTAFGVTVDSLKDTHNEFFIMGKNSKIGALTKFRRLFGFSIFTSLLTIFKVPMIQQNVTEFFKRIVKETIRFREDNGIVRPDMIEILLEARKGISRNEDVKADDKDEAAEELHSGRKYKKLDLSDDDIVAQALVFFLAGFETTSTLLCFFFYELAVNPDVQSKLRDEVEEAWNRNGATFNYEVISEMKYLNMVVSEALRLWAAPMTIDRMCVKDYEIAPKLPGETLITIKEGTSISMPIIAIHRDSRYYPNPNKFDPERFSAENKSNITPCTYMPFGFGPRHCIASRYSILDVKVVMCHLLLKCELVPTAKTVTPIVFSKKNFSLVPDGGVWFGFKRRGD